jgi:hypothetical protein
MKKVVNLGLLAAGLCALSPCALGTYQQTGYLSPINILMDNGVTYFAGFTTTGNCANNRLMLSETGDYFGAVENGRRMYALIVAAQLAGKAISLGYNDTDGPNCRLAEVYIQW